MKELVEARIKAFEAFRKSMEESIMPNDPAIRQAQDAYLDADVRLRNAILQEAC